MEPATPIKEGFYLDPETKKIFYYKKVKNIQLIPNWVKSKPEQWKKIDRK